MKNIISMLDSKAPYIPENDEWQILDSLDLIQMVPENHRLILPFREWLNSNRKVSITPPKAFWLDNEIDVHLLKPWLDEIELIALNFPKFVDGRAYSQAVELRNRLKWTGEVRAIGDVLRDQLSHMYRCGFNSFAIREDKDIADAIKGLSLVSTSYSGSVIEPNPLFRRRHQEVKANEVK